MGQNVLGLRGDARQFGRLQADKSLMQRLHDVEIGYQGAQFGGRAELQLGTGIDVERLVHAVGVDAQVVAVRTALIQHETVGHLVDDLAAREQLVSDHAHLLGEFRVGQSLQDSGNARLGRGVHRRLGAQVETVERVKARLAEQRHQPGARFLGRLLLDPGHLGDRRRVLAVFEFGIERRVTQVPVDVAGVVERPEIAVAQFAEAFAIADQVMTRQAAGEQQRQHLAINLALASPLFLVLGRAGQNLGGVVEVGAEPDVERVRQADHLAIAGEGAERRRIEIGRNDLTAPIHRICAVDVDMRRGGQHLPQLFAYPAG